MKTIRLEKPGRLVLEETEAPTTPARGEVLVSVKHIGLCGTDIHAFFGRQPFFDYPRILGHELGVVVEQVGEAVKGLSVGQHCCVEPYLANPGDRAFARGKTNCTSTTRCLGVHVDGGMRERILLPAEKCHPSSLDTESLALVEMLCIGHHAVERAALLGDEIIAVIGVGPIGLGVVQFARQAGTRVIAIDVSSERLESCKQSFPEVDTLQIVPGQKLTEAWAAALGVFPEVVFDCTGNKQSMEAAITLPDFGGRIVMVGLFVGDVTFNDPDFHRRELSILATRNATARNFKDVISQLESGKIDPDNWITHHCSADEFPKTIENWLAPGSGLIKGIISF